MEDESCVLYVICIAIFLDEVIRIIVDSIITKGKINNIKAILGPTRSMAILLHENSIEIINDYF